eukprot:SM000244S08555  [mRNA]  locus=s244:117083:119975:- [translate_table: standard]
MDVAWLASVATAVKLLLVPAYRSTDFEVHRHWMALTRSLPLVQWYADETSEWTLDYPPLFAWLERLLAIPAAAVDPLIVDLHGGLGYASPATVLYLRSTVMVADCLLYYALWRFCRDMGEERRRLTSAAVLLSPGLIMVDHVHFQYNGFLLGILVLSLAMLKEGKGLLGGVLFALLVCLKHLFAVAGPVYLIDPPPSASLPGKASSAEIHGFGGISFGSSLGSLWSFLVPRPGMSSLFCFDIVQGKQLFTRLFPFGRGLCHAYWAPNVWAIYNVLDKALACFMSILRRHGVLTGLELPLRSGALTGGLVGDMTPYAILPSIKPGISMALVLLAMIPCLHKIWTKQAPSTMDMVTWVSYSYFCGYMLGWHVHEKATLHFVIPLALTCAHTAKEGSQYYFLSTVAQWSLSPLLFQPQEYPIKMLLLTLYSIGLYCGLSHLYQRPGNLKHADQEKVKLLPLHCWAYLLGLPVVELYVFTPHSDGPKAAISTTPPHLSVLLTGHDILLATFAENLVKD